MAINIISDLPLDLLEEILSKVPLTSMRAVRFTCKKWNDISKNRSFTEKRIAQAKKNQLQDLEVIMMNNFRIYLMSVNLHNNVDPSIKPKGKLISLNDEANLDISSVFHCDGLLLCISKDINFRLMVWNPNLGQTRWIKPRNSYHRLDNYALGYGKEENKKILRFVDNASAARAEEQICEFEVYSFKSNSWKVVLDVSPEWYIEFGHRGLSIKGNTYWYALKNLDSEEEEGGNDFLICFDFTRERFGPRLPLPFHVSAPTDDAVTLSSVGQDQLAVLYQDCYTLRMEIWVTSKIEPEEVSWNKLFLVVYLGPRIDFGFRPASFIIDQKKNVVVVIDKDVDFSSTRARAIAYIIGKKGYFKTVDLGRSADETCYPLVFSYVPSSVQINQLT